MNNGKKKKALTATNILIVLSVFIYVLDKYIFVFGDQMFETPGPIEKILGFCGGRVFMTLCFFDTSIVDGEMFVNGMHISPYDHGNIFNRDPMRVRKLLMHKKEIMRLLGTTKQQGLTLIPLSVYFKKGRAKVQVGLCKGKKLYDKRDVAAKKEANRNIEREMKERMR